jgi:shikimate 5-dehydrogenase
MVRFATDRSDNEDLQHFRQQLRLIDAESLPLVAYNTGELGRPSKVHNIMLTPVSTTVQALADADSSHRTGDVTIREITQALFASWEYDRLRYHVYGTSERAFSRSPNMYRAAFELYAISHTMHYRSAASIEEVLDCTRSEDFGGAAVSFPFKEAAFEACALQSKHAIAIGSVNSIIPLRILAKGDRLDLAAQAAQRNRRGPSDGLYGDNCDWLGFYHSIRNKQ